MNLRHVLFAFAVVLVGWMYGMPVFAQQGAPKLRQLSLENKPWKGDFDQMLKRRVIRVLVPYSRTLYFVDQGRERGVTADLVRDFERYINKKYAKQLGKRPLTVFLIVTTRDKALSDVVEGLGDIAAEAKLRRRCCVQHQCLGGCFVFVLNLRRLIYTETQV